MAKQPTVRARVDEHRGEDFLVCGMGTSLDQYPVEFYRSFPGVTVGVNEITDLFVPDYHFMNYKYHPEYENEIIVRGEERPISFEYTEPSAHIDIHKTGKLSKRGTVAIPALTLAYQLGAGRIFIIGVDFYPDDDGNIYFKDCSKRAPDYYQLADEKDPELQATLRCFADAFRQYRTQGVEVYNLSLNSRLDLKTVEWPDMKRSNA